MVQRSSSIDAPLQRLRSYIADADLTVNSRLPPERALCDTLGVTRTQLRSALSVLEKEGTIWRHVGRGTFIGNRALESAVDVSAIAHRTNPLEVMNARLMLEPEIARLAALNATPARVAAMRSMARRARNASSWRQYETADNALHRLFADSTQNGLVVGLLDTLNAVRRQVTWGRLREQPTRPPPDHHSFVEHDKIIAAIEERDTECAARAMRTHLLSVERRLRGI